MLWLKGLNNIAIVDTDLFQEQEIPNFFTHELSSCFGLMAVADKSMKKVMGFGYNNLQQPTLHVYDMNPKGGYKSTVASEIIQSKCGMLSRT